MAEPSLRFGPYKGKPLSEVPTAYLFALWKKDLFSGALSDAVSRRLGLKVPDYTPEALWESYWGD
jgi:hypothetical protein